MADDCQRRLGYYYNRLEDELSREIGRSIGHAGYDEMFGILAGQRLSQLKHMKALWEGVTVLFSFRNVLAHGREVMAFQFKGGAVPGGFREEFAGSYRAVEDYLHKKKLLTRKFVDAHEEHLFLSGQIADHFAQLARSLPEAVISSLSAEEQASCRVALNRATGNL